MVNAQGRNLDRPSSGQDRAVNRRRQIKDDIEGKDGRIAWSNIFGKWDLSIFSCFSVAVDLDRKVEATRVVRLGTRVNRSEEGLRRRRVAVTAKKEEKDLEVDRLVLTKIFNEVLRLRLSR